MKLLLLFIFCFVIFIIFGIGLLIFFKSLNNIIPTNNITPTRINGSLLTDNIDLTDNQIFPDIINETNYFKYHNKIIHIDKPIDIDLSKITETKPINFFTLSSTNSEIKTKFYTIIPVKKSIIQETYVIKNTTIGHSKPCINFLSYDQINGRLVDLHCLPYDDIPKVINDINNKTTPTNFHLA